MKEESAMTTRRALLAAAAGSAAAIAATAGVPGAVLAADPNDLVLNQDNATTAETGITQSTDDVVGFRVTSTNGVGIQGISSTASAIGHQATIGVMGVFEGSSQAPTTQSRTGVYGFASDDGTAGIPTGVVGQGDDTGVYGNGPIGVDGEGDVIGVFAAAISMSVPGAIALWAHTVLPSQRALKVEGRAEFSRSGRSYVSAGASSRTINLAGVTSSSLVFAVLSTSRSGISVRAVAPTSGKFVVYLNAKVPGTTYFQWIVFTNPANHGG
jgi:hypothetical protein